jgi:hypothetical protein
MAYDPLEMFYSNGTKEHVGRWTKWIELHGDLHICRADILLKFMIKFCLIICLTLYVTSDRSWEL